MSVDIQHIAFAVRQLCRTSASPFNLGHAQQLVAAALGYDSLAAHQAAVRQGKEASDLQAASHVVLERQRVLDRAASLGLTASPQDLITWLSQGFQGCLPRCRQHRYDGALEEHIQARLVGTEQVRDDHRANEERQGLEAVRLGSVGAGAPIGLARQPGARIAIVIAALAARLVELPGPLKFQVQHPHIQRGG